MQNLTPLVSVVVPTYNQEAYIAETLQSILNQTYTNLEIIVSDDGSTDRTQEIILWFTEIDSRIKPFFSSQNKGIPYNFNRAFDACTGEWIAFFSGDDIMLPEKIAKQIDFVLKNPTVSFLMHEVELFDQATERTLYIHRDQKKLKIPRNTLDWALPTKWLFEKRHLSVLPTSTLAHRSYYLQSRYNERFRFKHELLFHIENHAKQPNAVWAVLPEVLSRYRVHSENFTNNKEYNSAREEEKFLIHAVVMEKYPQIFKKSQNFIHFTMFENLLFYEIAKKDKKYFFQFYREAGFIKFVYLIFCMFLKKYNLLFPFFKIFRKVFGI